MDPRTDKTKSALLRAAIFLGAREGFDNCSVRKIAQVADVNVSAVKYHFGSKEGLREATVDFIGEHMRTVGPGKVLRAAAAGDIDRLSARDARKIMRQTMLAAIKAAAPADGMEDVPSFIHREVFQSGETAQRFYERVFSQELDIMCCLVSRVTGQDPSARETRLRALTVIAQSVFMSLAKSLVHVAMDWNDYGEAELDMLADAFWLEG